jgi:hypothetical protein
MSRNSSLKGCDVDRTGKEIKKKKKKRTGRNM